MSFSVDYSWTILSSKHEFDVHGDSRWHYDVIVAM